MNHIKNYLSLIKFSHTIFAMPFALIVIGVLLAVWGLDDNGGMGELLAVFALILAGTGIAGLALVMVRSFLKR